MRARPRGRAESDSGSQRRSAKPATAGQKAERDRPDRAQRAGRVESVVPLANGAQPSDERGHDGGRRRRQPAGKPQTQQRDERSRGADERGAQPGRAAERVTDADDVPVRDQLLAELHAQQREEAAAGDGEDDQPRVGRGQPAQNISDGVSTFAARGDVERDPHDARDDETGDGERDRPDSNVSTVCVVAPTRQPAGEVDRAVREGRGGEGREQDRPDRGQRDGVSARDAGRPAEDSHYADGSTLDTAQLKVPAAMQGGFAAGFLAPVVESTGRY